ncbi:SWIM zinc finger family protein [Streptomyces sp. NPDC060194]|uniref:SWIM zinc finger family protein n=1 Tax=Streptomyces sp. NPDC060194 TaxID=3347069 RepID=UPI00366A087F
MTQQGDRNGVDARWSAEQVLALAPDAASRKAGSRLGSAGPWSEHGAHGGAVWGLCKGSGSKPYRIVVDTAGPAYKCSCPSRKFPCKHALGLLLLWSSGTGSLPDAAAVPEWAEPWLAARKERASAPKPTAAAASADPEAARRRAERRAQRITAGTAELEQRLADLVSGGLAAADRSGYALWEETAARMVDAQAPGLASRVRELGAVPSSGPGWHVRLLEECGLLHLLDRAWAARESLPAPLAATVRARVGLPTAPGPDAGVRDRWLVLAQYDTSDGKLTTRRIHLHGTATGRPALLLSFGAAGRAPELALPVGLAVDAEAAFHPGALPLRAQLGESSRPLAGTGERPPGTDAAGAAAAYGERLRDDPWLESWPLTLAAAIPAPHGESWQLADADGRSALPLTSSFARSPGLWRLVALSGGAPLRVFGELGHRGFDPLTAWTADSTELVPLR